MSTLALFALPLLALTSPTPNVQKRHLLNNGTILVDGTPDFAPSIPLPGSGLALANHTCHDSQTTNLWSGITAFEPPLVLPTDPNNPPLLIQEFQPPNPTDCDLIAHFSFSNTGTNKIGNTQTITLPGNAMYALTFTLADKSSYIKNLKVWDSPAPPAKGKYNKAGEFSYSGKGGQDWQGGEWFSIWAKGKRNVHLEIEFAATGARGTIGFWSTALGPEKGGDGSKDSGFWADIAHAE